MPALAHLAGDGHALQGLKAPFFIIGFFMSGFSFGG
jgi:hypothetical protein